MPLDTLLNAFIDANILLALAALVWATSRYLIKATRLRTSYASRLSLLYGVLLVTALTPMILALISFAFQSFGNTGLHSFTLTDVVLSQYLDGRFSMAPSRVELLLNTRDTLVHEILTQSSVLGLILATALIMGLCFAVMRSAIQLLQLRRFLSNSFIWHRTPKLDILLSDETAIPFSTRGLRHYYIVIPSSMLSRPVDLRVALAHEFQHIRQGDLTWELILEAFRPLFIFNPAHGYWKREVEKLRELACDQQVLRRYKISATEYCACLLRVCERALLTTLPPQARTPAVALLCVRNTRAERFLRRRVEEALSHHTQVAASGPSWMVAAFLLPLSCAIALSAVSIQRSADWSQDRLMLSTIVNLERLNLRNGSDN